MTAAVAFVIGTSVAAGVALAAIPHSTSATISACYAKSGSATGALRVIDAQKGATCNAREGLLTWSSRAFQWKGEWTKSASYGVNDVVRYQGGAYIALVANKGLYPTLPTRRGTWAVLAAHGAQGAQGASRHCNSYPREHVDFTLPGSTPGHGCNLTGANLANFNLRGAKLTNANLTRVDVSNALMFGVDFTGATITGIVWSHTECPDHTLSDANGTKPESCVGHLVHDGPDGGPGD